MQATGLLHTAFLKICILFLATGAQAQQTAQKFIVETQYLLYLPEGYQGDTSARWPLVLFLHGSGESGHDVQKVKLHGPPQLVEEGRKFPFILVSPQSEVPRGWDAENLYKLLQHIKRSYRVDDRRIYLTGLSMGGFGTWALAMKHPEEFAAMAPVCGGGDTTDAWKLRNIPIWCFHGAKDDVVPPSGSANMVKAAGRYNPSVRFTLYPNANHNSWDTTYNNDSLYQWMLAQKKFSYKEIDIKSEKLKKYEGFYLGPDKDTVQILVNSNSLIAKPGNQTVPLKPAGENLFFIDPDKPMDIHFTSNRSGISGFVFMGDRNLFYKKL